MRFFDTEGPVGPGDHYAMPPLDRVEVDELPDLVRSGRCFVLHAPRQTGRTSAPIVPRDLLNGGEAGSFRCVDVNVEVGRVARDDSAAGIRAVPGSPAVREPGSCPVGRDRGYKCTGACEIMPSHAGFRVAGVRASRRTCRGVPESPSS